MFFNSVFCQTTFNENLHFGFTINGTYYMLNYLGFNYVMTTFDNKVTRTNIKEIAENALRFINEYCLSEFGITYQEL